MGNKWKHRRDDGGSMLATVLVIGVGAGFLTFFAVAAPNELERWLIPAVCGVALLLLVLLVRLRWSSSSSRSGLAFWLSAKNNFQDDGIAGQYRPRKVSRADEVRPGINQPITASEVREIKNTSAHAWAPSKESKPDDRSSERRQG